MGTVDTWSAKTLADDVAEGEKDEDVEMVQATVVETEVAVGGDVGKSEALGDVEMKGVEGDVVIENSGGGEGGKGVGLVVGVEEDGDGMKAGVLVELEGGKGGNGIKAGYGDGMKAGDDGDARGVVAVEFFKGVGGNGTKAGDGDGEGMVKGAGAGEGTGVVLKSSVRESDGLGQIGGIKQNNGSLSDGGKVVEMSDDEDGEEDSDGGDLGRKFEVGDFVWGKIKSHPWWPGVIYDEKDASEFAAKKKPLNRLLVGYFGDGTFSWCRPSQLKPFVENVEGLSKVSQSKNFVNALQNTLDVIGRLVELEFDSSLAEEKRRGLDRPLANNTGVKADVLVPVGGIRRSSVLQYEANRLLADLKSVATHFSALNMLQLTVLKSYLSAFYHAKGGYQLPSYIAPQPIPGLEDKTGQGGNKKHGYGYAVDPPAMGPSIEDWHSSPSQSATNKLAETLDKKSVQQRKQKSMADILGENTDVQATKNLSTGRRRRKASAVSDEQNGIGSSSKTKKRKTMQSKASNGDGDADVGEEDQALDQSREETDDGSMSAKKTMIRVLNLTSEDSEADKQTGTGSHSRERKKSKYLSPPFTTPSQSQKKKALEAESIRISKKARVSEKMTKAASNLMSRSPALKNDSETGQRKHAEKHAKQPKNIQVSANEVLSGLMSAACSPTFVGDNKAFSGVKEYLYAFRSSVYSDESDEKADKSEAGQKGKAPVPETSMLHDDVLKEKINLMSSMVDMLDRENALELKPKLKEEIEVIKERIVALTGPSSSS